MVLRSESSKKQYKISFRSPSVWAVRLLFWPRSIRPLSFWLPSCFPLRIHPFIPPSLPHSQSVFSYQNTWTPRVHCDPMISHRDGPRDCSGPQAMECPWWVLEQSLALLFQAGTWMLTSETLASTSRMGIAPKQPRAEQGGRAEASLHCLSPESCHGWD